MAFDIPTGPGPLMMYKVDGGALQVADVLVSQDEATARLGTTYVDRWTNGWTSIVAVRAHGRPWYLTYKTGSGTVTINHLCG
jgi:hypothetical protein